MQDWKSDGEPEFPWVGLTKQNPNQRCDHQKRNENSEMEYLAVPKRGKRGDFWFHVHQATQQLNVADVQWFWSKADLELSLRMLRLQPAFAQVGWEPQTDH